MKRTMTHSILQPLLLLLFVTMFAFYAVAAEKNKTTLLVLEEPDATDDEKNINPLEVSLFAVENGIKVTVFYKNKFTDEKQKNSSLLSQADISEGGQLIMFLDGMVIDRQDFVGNMLEIEKTIDSSLVSSGNHNFRFEVLSYPGGTYLKDVAFRFDAVPTVKISSLDTDFYVRNSIKTKCHIL